MAEILILCTTDTPELAKKIASALVEAREAACVNIIPGLQSIYRWQGKICDEQELLLLIKTTESRFNEVRDHIRRLHTYQVPEIVSIPIIDGDPEYLSWLRGQTSNP